MCQVDGGVFLGGGEVSIARSGEGKTFGVGDFSVGFGREN